MGTAFVSIIHASESGMTTAFPSVFCIMGTGQRDMLRNGREQVIEHLYPEGGVAGHLIFDPVGILVELQADVLHCIVFIESCILSRIPFMKPARRAFW